MCDPEPSDGVARPQKIVAFVRSTEALEGVKRGSRGSVVQFCAYEEDLPRAAGRDDIAMIVWETGRDAAHRIPTIAEAAAGRVTPISILARLDLDQVTERTAVALARYLPHVTISLRGFDLLERDIELLCHSVPERSPSAAIIDRLVPLAGNRAGNIIAVASLWGYCRRSLDAFANACNMPPRTLESRLQSAGLLPPSDVLGWMLALYSVWQLDVLGWSAKATAAAAGFRSTGCWSRYIERHVRARPRQLLDWGGFPPLLDRCTAEIVRRAD
jgi:hypothetical protein